MAYAVGTVLFLLSLAYVAISVSKNWSTVATIRFISPAWLILCVAAYAVSHISTGLSWPLAVRQTGTKMSLRDGIRIGLVAQIGKYLPGNIAHYAGRGILAKQLGVPLKASGISTAIELGSALTAAILIAAFAFLLDPTPISRLPAITTTSAAILFGLLAALSATWIWLFRRGAKPALLAGPTLCLATSFCLSSASIYSLCQSLDYPLPLTAAVGAFTLAWAAGFIIPGAPAGLGVREATWLAMVGPMIGAGPAVAAAILHRLITATVDALAALLGYAWLASGSLAKK